LEARIEVDLGRNADHFLEGHTSQSRQRRLFPAQEFLGLNGAASGQQASGLGREREHVVAAAQVQREQPLPSARLHLDEVAVKVSREVALCERGMQIFVGARTLVVLQEIEAPLQVGLLVRIQVGLDVGDLGADGSHSRVQGVHPPDHERRRMSPYSASPIYSRDCERGTRNVSLVNVETLAAALKLTMAELFEKVARFESGGGSDPPVHVRNTSPVVCRAKFWPETGQNRWEGAIRSRRISAGPLEKHR